MAMMNFNFIKIDITHLTTMCQFMFIMLFSMIQIFPSKQKFFLKNIVFNYLKL